MPRRHVNGLVVYAHDDKGRPLGDPSLDPAAADDSCLAIQFLEANPRISCAGAALTPDPDEAPGTQERQAMGV